MALKLQGWFWMQKKLSDPDAMNSDVFYLGTNFLLHILSKAPFLFVLKNTVWIFHKLRSLKYTRYMSTADPNIYTYMQIMIHAWQISYLHEDKPVQQ